MEAIAIPDPVIEIGSSAFSNCSALTEITLPGSLRTIGSSAFSGCSDVKNVYVINPVPPVIESSTFSGTYTATLHVPEGSEAINWIHPYWGKFNSIENWIVGTRNEFVAENITYHITSEVDATVEISAAQIVNTRADEAIRIPKSVTFNGKVYRVAGIANNGFAGCEFSSIILPSSIGYVGLEAFKGCDRLTSLTVEAMLPPSVGDNSFDESAYSRVTLVVPESVTEDYKNHSVWGKFSLSGQPEESGIENIVPAEGSTGVSVAVENHILLVTAPEDAEVAIYSMSGLLVMTTTEHRIEGLAGGIYIVRVAGRTFKVAI